MTPLIHRFPPWFFPSLFRDTPKIPCPWPVSPSGVATLNLGVICAPTHRSYQSVIVDAHLRIVFLSPFPRRPSCAGLVVQKRFYPSPAHSPAQLFLQQRADPSKSSSLLQGPPPYQRLVARSSFVPHVSDYQSESSP